MQMRPLAQTIHAQADLLFPTSMQPSLLGGALLRDITQHHTLLGPQEAPSQAMLHSGVACGADQNEIHI